MCRNGNPGRLGLWEQVVPVRLELLAEVAGRGRQRIGDHLIALLAFALAEGFQHVRSRPRQQVLHLAIDRSLRSSDSVVDLPLDATTLRSVVT